MLGENCGHHCGTANGQTRHCVCCHGFSYGEADGCQKGWDGGAWFDFAETHEPGSHVLEALFDTELAEVEALVFG